MCDSRAYHPVFTGLVAVDGMAIYEKVGGNQSNWKGAAMGQGEKGKSGEALGQTKPRQYSSTQEGQPMLTLSLQEAKARKEELVANGYTGPGLGTDDEVEGEEGTEGQS
jgi:hypothetical protein